METKPKPIPICFTVIIINWNVFLFINAIDYYCCCQRHGIIHGSVSKNSKQRGKPKTKYFTQTIIVCKSNTNGKTRMTWVHGHDGWIHIRGACGLVIKWEKKRNVRAWLKRLFNTRVCVLSKRFPWQQSSSGPKQNTCTQKQTTRGLRWWLELIKHRGARHR